MPHGRPPLAIGTYGNLQTKRLPGGKYEARARFRDYDGVTREVRRVRPTAEAARNALRAELMDRATPSSEEISSASRLDLVLTLWTAEKFPSLSDNSRRRYREVIDDHISGQLGALRLTECTTGTLDRYLKTLARETGHGTAKHAKTILSQALDLAVRHDALRTNPVNGVAGVTATRTKETRALTPAEIAAAGQALKDWQAGKDRTGKAGRPRSQDLYALFIVGIQTGARIGELLALRWQDIDLEAKTVTICGTLHRPDVPNPTWTRKEQTKSGKARTVDLPPTALSLLFDLYIKRPAGNVHDAVFPSDNGTWRDPGNIRKTLRQIWEPLKMDWITPHIFRSTAATHVNAEMSLEDAAQQLGHGNSDTTARYYVQKTSRGPAVAEAMERLISGA